MTSVVISERFGGFGLSPQAVDRINELGTPLNSMSERSDIARDNLHLVQAVQELGDAASGGYAKLVIVEVPDDVQWYIHEYDGYESIYEKHRVWDSTGEEVFG